MTQSHAVNSYDEWSRLHEVIVGSADHYDFHHLDATFRLFHFENLKQILENERFQKAYLDLAADIRSELEEDVEGLAQALRECGVTVHRPVRLAHSGDIKTPYWSSRPTPALNVRDQTIILGDTILETAPQQRARYFENDALKPVFYEYLRRGSRWLAMPRPTLGRGSLDPSFFLNQGHYLAELSQDSDAEAVEGLGYELAFDGAQCIRLGRDVLVNVANKNHELALNWLVTHFSDRFVFHRLEGMSENHIDSHIVPLRPGLMILRSPQYRYLLPKKMQDWDVIVPPEVTDARFPDYGDRGLNLASRYIDINVLSVDESTVIVNSLYPELIHVLEKYGFDVIPVRHRHRRLFNGGFHCFTLDCVREGGPESYFYG